MMTGAMSDAPEATIVATKAATTLRRWPAITGASRLSAAPTDALRCCPCALLSLYGFVVAGASLGVIDLDVLGTCLKQLLVGACRQHLTLHERHDLVVVLDRRDLLRHRQQGQARIVLLDVLEDLALGRGIDARGEIVEQQHTGIECQRPRQHDAL